MTGTKLLDHWSPPDGAGAALACFATTFTFDADFFAQDCLSRFLSLSTAANEGDSISSIAAILEEEDRLSEAQVSVLVDRSSPADKRNLRWDVLPVGVVGGLLHAKVAALLWERSARIILGSANLTPAGYRRQVEIALAIDLDERCAVPRQVLDDFVTELGELTTLLPAAFGAPRARALGVLDLLAARISELNLPAAGRRDLRLSIAPARPGVCPLDSVDSVWHGAQPLRATVLSPFWDDVAAPPAVSALRARLTGRPAAERTMTFVIARDPFSGALQAPRALGSEVGADVVIFEPPDDNERRSLHAKLVLLETDDWLAALIGSSNFTKSGLGLDKRRGHRELNLWLGCPAESKVAKQLRALASAGDAVDLDTERFELAPDEDEPVAPVLPIGFVSCVVSVGPPASLDLAFDADGLPAEWSVRTPAGSLLLDADQWAQAGSSATAHVELESEALPAFLSVDWHDAGVPCQATWPANVADRSALPPPAELRELPVDVLLSALASTRPLPAALEFELRRRERVVSRKDIQLDPLRRFDDSALLLQRARHLSLALWRLQDRLGRPASSIDALHWRLHGTFGPLAIADGLVRAAADGQTIPGEAHFLLAELALTVSAVDWSTALQALNAEIARALVADVLAGIEERRQSLGPSPDPRLDAYVTDALVEARR